jgi:mannose-6-phosphate isomerase-like protein (cupin superfamily)
MKTSLATAFLLIGISGIGLKAQEQPLNSGSCGVTQERGEVCVLGGLQSSPEPVARMVGPKLTTINYNVASQTKAEFRAEQENRLVVFLRDGHVDFANGDVPIRVTAGYVLSLPHGSHLSIRNLGTESLTFVLISILE